MRSRGVGLWASAVLAAAGILLPGCSGSDGQVNGNGNGNGNDNGVPFVECTGNHAPSAVLVDPADGASIGVGSVNFAWMADDPDGDRLVATVFVGTQPFVFEDPILRQEQTFAPGSARQEMEVQLPQTGSFFWGLEIEDPCGEVVRQPAEGAGVSFAVGRADASGVILLCPLEDQPARQSVTFQWSTGQVTPTRTQIFVSRSDQPNPFATPLEILEVTPPTATSRTLTGGEILPLSGPGEAFGWGLRLESAAGGGSVVFTFQGQQGATFRVQPNVPPAGRLVGPPDRTVLAANTPLQWQADPGNCGDPLSSTVFLEFLGDADAPQALFESPIRVDVEAGQFELDLFSRVVELGMQSGVWAWGVLAGDGTNQTQLPDSDAARVFRTIVQRRCLTDAECNDRLFCNGLETCLNGTCAGGLPPCERVCIEEEDRCAECRADIDCDDGEFCNGAEACVDGVCAGGAEPCTKEQNCNEADDVCETPQSPSLCSSDAACDDGLFCNGAESCNPRSGCASGRNPCDDGIDCTMDFCNEESDTCAHEPISSRCDNGVFCDGAEVCTIDLGCQPGQPPCQGPGAVAGGTVGVCVEAGTLAAGIIVNGVYASNADNNPLSGEICNAQQPMILWRVDSAPRSSQVSILKPNVLQTDYLVFGPPGTYVFRLIDLSSQASDTVSLTLSAPP